MITSQKLFVIALSLLLTSTQISCSDSDDSTADCEAVVCTNIFIRINVTVTDESQNPVALDSYRVMNTENGNDITISLSSYELEAAWETGLYPLTQDGILGLNEEQQLQFSGFINGEEVVRANYGVGRACCHVGLISGDLQLTL